MKKVLLLFLAALSCRYLQAQPVGACSVTNFTVKFKSSSSPSLSGKSNITVDIFWYQDVNNGNKFTFLSLWDQASYQKFNFNNSKNVPKSADLAQALGVVVVKNDGGNLSLATTYTPDPAYRKVLPGNNGNAAISKMPFDASFDLVYIKDLVIPNVMYNAGDDYSLTGDVWSSQAADGITVQCSSQNYEVDINKFADRSLFICNSPENRLGVQVASKKPSTSGSYTVYIDANDNNMVDGTDVKLVSSEFKTGPMANMGGDYPYTYTAPVASIPAPYRSKQLLLLISGKTNASRVATTTLSTIFNSCAPLPVTFKSFTATRNKQKVALKWETASEQDNKGFYIQRFVNGEWKDVALVFSKTPDGNSSTLLAYEYSDVNTARGVSQYRLLQMDFSGKSKYSDVRTVPGTEQTGSVVIYPNPSTGTIHIVLEGQSVKDVLVSDVAGRIVKQYMGIATSTLVIENLTTGFYAVKITDRTTGLTAVEKVVIK